MASCTMLVGLLVLAMPISIISMNFDLVWNDWLEDLWEVARPPSTIQTRAVGRRIGLHVFL